MYRLTAIAILAILSIALMSGCEKHNAHVDSPSRTLTYVSNVGDLTYNNGRLETYGDYDLLYEGPELTGLRRVTRDTTLNKFSDQTDTLVLFSRLRYSYFRENGLIRRAVLDTFFQKSELNGSPAFIDELTGCPAGVYSYSGKKLDSILILKTPGEDQISKVLCQYNADGNISKQTVYHAYKTSPLPPTTQPTVVTTTFLKYDHHPNPWYMLFKQTSVLLPGMELRNVSKNNPLKAHVVTTLVGGDKFELDITYSYQYDESGYPTRASVKGSNDPIYFKYEKD